MEITAILWNNDRGSHIAKHGIELYEVEEAVFYPYGVTKKIIASHKDSNQYVYRYLGRSIAGRYIAFFYIHHSRGIVYPVTARAMTVAERRSYNASKR